jgi:hypothetical protein
MRTLNGQKPLLDPGTAEQIRADLLAAKRIAPEITFIDRINALERAVLQIVAALEER